MDKGIQQREHIGGSSPSIKNLCGATSLELVMMRPTGSSRPVGEKTRDRESGFKFLDPG